MCGRLRGGAAWSEGTCVGCVVDDCRSSVFVRVTSSFGNGESPGERL